MKVISKLTRNTGETSFQMRTAPTGATYVWCNNHLFYAKELAKFLGREDLRIVGHDFVLCGIDPEMIIFDHACNL